jgi:hypothetical protein
MENSGSGYGYTNQLYPCANQTYEPYCLLAHTIIGLNTTGGDYPWYDCARNADPCNPLPFYGLNCTTGTIKIQEYALSGVLPDDMDLLPVNITYFEISDNYLSGTLPPSIGNMTNLQVLDLSSNRLFGTIPSSFGNLKNLTSLDLSYNQNITGGIPPELANATQLKLLNLVSTNINGTIPAEVYARLQANGGVIMIDYESFICGTIMCNSCLQDSGGNNVTSLPNCSTVTPPHWHLLHQDLPMLHYPPHTHQLQ